MATFQVTWVGDKVREYTTKAGQSYRSRRIAVRDEGGNRITKLEISRPADQELPEQGDEISGGIKPHAKFDDLSVFVEGASGEGLSVSTNGGGGTQAPADTSRERSIESQVALKVAGVMLSSYVAIGAIKPEEIDDYLAKFTKAGVNALRGREDSEGKDESAAKDGAPEERKADVDSDIPF